MKKYKSIIISIILLVVLGLNPQILRAQEITIDQIPDITSKNDFTLGPTKFTYDLNPGDSIVSEIQITSRIENSTRFTITIEDFTSQEDPEKYTKFLGDEKSQFSSKEWFHPAVQEFNLNLGERATVPIQIEVPDNAEPGEHYSAVFFQITSENPNNSAITFSSRIGSLFLLNIGSSDINQSGNLDKFDTNKEIYTQNPITFKMNFRNTGDVHLEPSGKIIISNIFGKTIDIIDVAEWVILRDSDREQTSIWNPDFKFGKFTATAQIDRGYDSMSDLKTVTFYILPIKEIGYAFIIITILIIFIKFISSKFEIKRKL